MQGHSNETSWPWYASVAPELWFYLPAHPEARLTEAEQQAFVRGLVDTFGDEKEGGSGHD